jgi:hypothetical protein
MQSQETMLEILLSPANANRTPFQVRPQKHGILNDQKTISTLSRTCCSCRDNRGGGLEEAVRIAVRVGRHLRRPLLVCLLLLRSSSRGRGRLGLSGLRTTRATNNPSTRARTSASTRASSASTTATRPTAGGAIASRAGTASG